MTDDDLVAAALALASKKGRPIPGISERVVRLWRERSREGREIELRGPSREALRRFLAGDVGARTVDYWRGVAASAERMARSLADMLAAELTEPLDAADDSSESAAPPRVAMKAPVVDTPEALALRARSIAAVEAVRRAEAAPPHRPEAVTKPSRRPKAG